MSLISIDIGSTWTKGALITLEDNGRLRVVDRVARPTTVADLQIAFFDVYENLSAKIDVKTDLFYSSSAKGGLSVAAIGLVPEVTAEMAKVTAYSAGAKLTQSFSYYLTADDIKDLEDTQPDIILFAGGSDGGNEEYVCANAEALASAKIDGTIVYAGNRSACDFVRQALQCHDLIIADNILPELDRPNPDHARQAINDIFLSKIVVGKGLDQIIKKTGETPKPTPLSIFEFVTEIPKHAPEWHDFLVFDLGGATTDVYSCHEEQNSVGVVHRGLPEPVVKRTVEGDLGMRVSALSAGAVSNSLISTMVKHDKTMLANFQAHIDIVTQCHKILPRDQREEDFDALLAGGCITHACMRHAGRMHEVSTTDGLVKVQIGRNLTNIKRIIGTGGYLASASNFPSDKWFAQTRIDERERQILSPVKTEFFRDKDYLFPLFANVARRYPDLACKAGTDCLISIEN